MSDSWSDEQWQAVESTARLLGERDGAGAPAPLDLSGEWADGPNTPSVCRMIADEAGVVFLVEHAERWDEVLDYYRDAFDAAQAVSE